MTGTSIGLQDHIVRAATSARQYSTLSPFPDAGRPPLRARPPGSPATAAPGPSSDTPTNARRPADIGLCSRRYIPGDSSLSLSEQAERLTHLPQLFDPVLCHPLRTIAEP